jgi:putative membrane protein
MNKELKEITTKKGIVLTEQLGQKHQDLLNELSKLKGSEFDKAYTKDMVSGHEKAIELFEIEAKKGMDADVKAWAEKWLPTLREHLKLAQLAIKDVNGK